MPDPPSPLIIPLAFAALTVAVSLRVLTGGRVRPPTYLGHLWAFFLVFAVADRFSIVPAVWVLAVISFRALREYFSLVDIRLEDRWAILFAYVSIPLMIYLVQIDWYGMFIISIPVYAFLVVPFLVALGGRRAPGTLLSIGTIDFGLFLFVYCLGHIGYLTLFSTWKAILLVAGVALCDLVDRLLPEPGRCTLGGAALRYGLSAPLTLSLALLLSGWTGIPAHHSVWLGLIIPGLVLMGNFTITAIESDLGIGSDRLEAGRGGILDVTRSQLFAAPVVFHYIRYFVMP
jgi:phosphatidate cytidylyltransferase